MTGTRYITITTTKHDDVMGGTATIEWVAIQRINKDGQDSRRRAFRTGEYTIRWNDGSHRTYARVGTVGAIGLVSEHIAPARLAAERGYISDADA